MGTQDENDIEFEEPTGGVEIPDPPEPDEDEGDEEPEREAAQAAPEKKKTRDEKKRERGRIREDNERLRAELEQERQARQRLEHTVTELGTTVRVSRESTERQTGQGDEFDRALEAVYAEQEQLEMVVASGAKFTPEQVEKLKQAARRLDLRKQEIIAARAAQRANGGGRQVDPAQAAYQAGVNMIRSKYPVQLLNDRIFLADAYAHAQRIQARNPQRDELSIIEEAYALAAKEHGHDRGGATDTQRQRYSGVGRGAGGGAGRQTEAPKRIPVSEKAARKLANELYRHIPDPNKRFEMWRQKAGPKIAAATAKK